MTSATMWLCTECRRLVQATALEGYRSTKERPECPHCRTHALVDPTEPTNVDALATMDEYDRMARLPRSTRALARMTRVAFAISGLSVIFAMLLLLAFGWGRGQVVFEVMAMLIAAVIAIPGGLIALRSVRRYWEQTRALPHPGRWSLALPAARGEIAARGELDCEEPLRSPLSGEPCVGYEIGIRYDRDYNGPLGTWLLLEQHCADVDVGGLAIPGNDAYLELPRTPFDGSDKDPRVEHFLRQRGIRGGREALHLYESRLGTNAVVEVRRDDNGVFSLSPW